MVDHLTYYGVEVFDRSFFNVVHDAEPWQGIARLHYMNHTHLAIDFCYLSTVQSVGVLSDSDVVLFHALLGSSQNVLVIVQSALADNLLCALTDLIKLAVSLQDLFP